MTNVSPFESPESSVIHEMGSPMEGETKYEAGPIGPFFIQNVDFNDEQFEGLKAKINNTVVGVDTIVMTMIKDIGLPTLDGLDAKETNKFVENKVMTAVDYYNDNYWENYTHRVGIDMDALEELNDMTEPFLEESTLLSVAKRLRNIKLKTMLMMDAERVVRLLIKDEAETTQPS